jgi:hypothetical protein
MTESYEVAVCALPWASVPHEWETMPNEIFKQKKEENVNKLFGQSYRHVIFEFSAKQQVTVENEHLQIGDLNIDREDIVSVRFADGRKCNPHYRSDGNVFACYYIALRIDCKSIDEVVDGINGTEHILIYLISSVGAYMRPDNESENLKLYDLTKYSFEDDLSISNEELYDLYELIKSKLSINDSDRLIVNDLIETPGHLKIEGWKNTNSQTINAVIEGDFNESGRSKGIQVGAFSASRSVSDGELNAGLEGNISNNSFVSEIKYIEMSSDKILILSDPMLELEYYQIDQIMRRKDGFSLDVNGTVYSVTSINTKTITSSEMRSAINNIQEHIKSRKQDDNVRQNNDDITSRLRNLKSLYDDGILSDTEYDSKKAKLLEEL